MRAPVHTLFFEVLRIGCTAFGGGLAAHFVNTMVRRRQWITQAEFLEGQGICNLVPGPNYGNFAAYVGAKVAGIRGGMAAIVAITLPGIIVAILLASFLQSANEDPLVQRALSGVAAGGVGMIIALGVQLVGGARASRWPLLLLALTMGLYLGLHLPLAVVFAIVLPVGIAINRPRPQR